MLFGVPSNRRVTFFKSEKMLYSKPYKSIKEQILLLEERGLLIDDNCEHYLRHLNYYRLSGYMIPFQKDSSTHLFNNNTRFSDILNLYIFDRELRLLLLDAIERIEISIRTHWAHYFAQTHGAHAHLEPNLSTKPHWHEKNITLLKKEIERSDELFISHYKNKYANPNMPPIWAVCEVMSLGVLSRWIKALKPSDARRKISQSYSIDYTVLMSFTEHLAYLRNLCAHHSRVWNRKMTKTFKVPLTKPVNLIKNFNLDQSSTRKIYNSLVMIVHFLNMVNPENHFKSHLTQLIDTYRIQTNSMGFPLNWRTLDIWRETTFF